MEYTKEMIFKMGQIYKSLLYVLNDTGKDPYPQSDIFPLKYLTMIVLQASRIGTPKRLDQEIGRFMDTLDPYTMEQLMDKPTPLALRAAWMGGQYKYRELTKIHPIESKRKELGLTQAALANMIDVSQKDISRWENYVCAPNTDSLKKLSAALECSIDDLIQ